MTEAVQTLDHSADTLLQGEHVPEVEPSISPERALWLAVIVNCWADAFSRSDTMIKNTDRTCDPDQVRAESRRWLVHNFGTWKQDREEACELAEIDPDMLREAARRKLVSIKAGETATAEVLNLDQAFARLLDNEAELTPSEISTALEELAALELAA